ncbi:MAG: TRAP transporter permease [Pseudomonadota bacterium]
MATNEATRAADDLVAQVDTGGRNPTGWQLKAFLFLCFIWSLFHLYIASNVPFALTEMLGINMTMPSSEARRVHLAFAILLGAMAFPLFKGSPRTQIPWYDWALGVVGVVCCIYAIVLKDAIAVRAGLPTTGDLVISAVGMFVLMVSVYRALGLPLVIISGVFIFYVFFGDARWLPDVIQWKGASFGKATWHYWMQDEGVFGAALKVSTELIFLFVLFGAILEKAGAGNYFIKLAFALLGHLRGGPAKAAVVASAMSGLYSGSSIANTVTTGTFTIPLMKRTGFSPEKAGAVEVASSTNGQLTPPVMGAAAFLIAEFTGIAYTDILKHALVPALVSYIALVYIVHLEAMKLNLKGLEKPPSSMTLAGKLIGVLFGFIVTAVLFGACWFVLKLVGDRAPDLSFTATAIIAAVAYVILLWFASRKPDLVVDPPDSPILELPRAGATAMTGLYYILPIVILIWCILPTPTRLSPSYSAFWAVVAMTIVTLTHRPLKALMRGEGALGAAFRRGVSDWIDGMISGARNMISIGIATGAAGIIIGSISLTGAHQVVGEFVEFLSGGNLIIMLILVAIMSLILGMGLPTTANYIVVSSLMAPVIVLLGAKSGLLVPLIAVHLFVFYFGILADDTPPVGLAAFAAAAISGGDPIKTGLQGFAYDIRTALLPFLFIFNTELLLIDVTWYKAIFIFIVATIAMMLFAAATQQWFLTRSRLWESAALLLVAFTLFRPGFWLDRVVPAYNSMPPQKVFEVVGEAPINGTLTMVVSGPDFDTGETSSTTLLVPLGDRAEAVKRLEAAGLNVTLEDGLAKIDEPFPGTPFFESIGKSFDYYADRPVQVREVRQSADRLPKEVFYIPALLLLGLVMFLQSRRKAATTVAA